MSLPGATFPPPKPFQQNAFGAPAFPNAAPPNLNPSAFPSISGGLNGPSPLGNGLAPNTAPPIPNFGPNPLSGGLPQPPQQDSFNLQAPQQAPGFPQTPGLPPQAGMDPSAMPADPSAQLGQAPGAPGQQPGTPADSAAGFSDKNTTLGGGSAFSGKNIGIGSVIVLGGLYVARGLFGKNWGLNLSWSKPIENAGKLVKDISNEVKDEITSGVKDIHDTIEAKLTALGSKPTKETVEEAQKHFNPLLEKVKKLTSNAQLNEADTKIHQDLIDAVETPLTEAKTASEATDEAKKSLDAKFVENAKKKFTDTQKAFTDKFGEDLKTEEAATSTTGEAATDADAAAKKAAEETAKQEAAKKQPNLLVRGWNKFTSFIPFIGK